MSRNAGWLRVAAGVLALGLGVAAFVWPSATLQVAGFLFGLNLLTMGVARGVLLAAASGTPVLGRVLGIVLSLAAVVLGVLCLRNLTGSVKLLLVLVALGWLVDGLAEIFTTIGAGGPGGGWRIALGLGTVLAGTALLVWPKVGLATFVLIGATALCFIGICLLFAGVATVRPGSRAVAGRG